MTSPSDGVDADARRDARRYVRRLRGFYVHAAVYAVSMVVIIIVNVVVTFATGNEDEWWAWWFVWPLVGWGLAVAIHGIAVRLSRKDRWGSEWEDRKVDELLHEADSE